MRTTLNIDDKILELNLVEPRIICVPFQDEDPPENNYGPC
jgi:hypothetical protein